MDERQRLMVCYHGWWGGISTNIIVVTIARLSAMNEEKAFLWQPRAYKHLSHS